MIGRTIRHYEVEEPLGKGGMGVVYRAKDTRLGRPVALKLLPAEFTRDPDRKARFIQEARAAAAVNHPAIAQIYEVDEDESGVFIAMELVPGKTVNVFFFQAEDGIRDATVTGVQTCALPIFAGRAPRPESSARSRPRVPRR